MNENWLPSLTNAEQKIDSWRTFYNQVRPHSALGWSKPYDYARKYAASSHLRPQLEPVFSGNERDKSGVRITPSAITQKFFTQNLDYCLRREFIEVVLIKEVPSCLNYPACSQLRNLRTITSAIAREPRTGESFLELGDAENPQEQCPLAYLG